MMGTRSTRLLEPALVIEDVIVAGRAGRELRAIQGASPSLASPRGGLPIEAPCAPEAVVMEAKLFGVGLLAQDSRVILQLNGGWSDAIDGWAWLLWERLVVSFRSFGLMSRRSSSDEVFSSQEPCPPVDGV